MAQVQPKGLAMKRTLISLAVMVAVPLAWAQDKPKPAAQQPAKPAAPAAQPAPAPMVADKPAPVARKMNPRRSEDARHCLEKNSNTEIIKCAEAYL
jgi:hypothetical protein